MGTLPQTSTWHESQCKSLTVVLVPAHIIPQLCLHFETQAVVQKLDTDYGLGDGVRQTVSIS